MQPAAYSANSTEEISATSIFKTSIDLVQVKPDIKELDKFPNIDGYLELTSIDQFPIGKLEVQIKKLSPKKSNKPSYQIGLEFLSYCENVAILPVLLVLVDVENKTCYWKHITPFIAAQLIGKATGKTTVIHFSLELDLIDGATKNYVAAWVEISKDHRKKIIGYDALKQIHDTDKVTLAELKKYIINPTGEKNHRFSAIYKFLDHYNHLLDHDFNSIKNVLYRNVWKIGIAYTDFEAHHLAYVLYGIEENTNDTLIKVLKNIKPNDVGFDHIRMAAMNYNPIIYQPESHAYKAIYDDLEKLLNLKAFLIVNGNLANEYLVSFLDNYSWLFGIKDGFKSKQYDIQKFKRIVFERWPDILFEMRYKYYTTDYLDRNKELDVSLNDLISHFKEKRSQFSSLLSKSPSGRFLTYRDKVILHSDSYNIRLIKRYIEELESKGNKSIKRLYAKPDLKNDNGLIWGGYSRQATFANIQLLFRNFIDAYHQYLNIYFPYLYDELKFYKNYDVLMVVLGNIDARNIYPPKISITKYRDKNRKVLPSIEFYLEENLPKKYENYWWGNQQNRKGAMEWCGTSGITFPFVYNTLPLYSYLYKHVANVFKDYFKQKTEGKDGMDRSFF